MIKRKHGITKSQGRKHGEDKFYTLPSVAEQCASLLDISSYERVIEPSAGSGSFSNLFDDCLAFDINPEHPSVVQQDWFEYEAERIPGRTLVIGNPPFGQQNTLAVKFINHAAPFADTVAMILPLSFKRKPTQNKIDRSFSITKELILPKNSFTLNNEPYHVPCVFQVWDHTPNLFRELTKKVAPVGFEFVPIDQNPHLAIQRVGSKTGKATENWRGLTPQVHYFLRLNDPTRVDDAVSRLNSIDIPERDYGVGPRSLNKGEITIVFNDVLARLSS